MTKVLKMQHALAVFTLMVLLAVGIPTALGGSGGPALHWPPHCPPSC